MFLYVHKISVIHTTRETDCSNWHHHHKSTLTYSTKCLLSYFCKIIPSNSLDCTTENSPIWNNLCQKDSPLRSQNKIFVNHTWLSRTTLFYSFWTTYFDNESRDVSFYHFNADNTQNNLKCECDQSFEMYRRIYILHDDWSQRREKETQTHS